MRSVFTVAGNVFTVVRNVFTVGRNVFTVARIVFTVVSNVCHYRVLFPAPARFYRVVF